MQAPPKPTLNGGLYTGNPFPPNAPWRNFPVTPDAGFYSFTNLNRTSTAPHEALYHMPASSIRPGNNTPFVPSDYAKSKLPSFDAVCVPTDPKVNACPNPYVYDNVECGNMGFRGLRLLG